MFSFLFPTLCVSIFNQPKAQNFHGFLGENLKSQPGDFRNITVPAFAMFPRFCEQKKIVLETF